MGFLLALHVLLQAAIGHVTAFPAAELASAAPVVVQEAPRPATYWLRDLAVDVARLHARAEAEYYLLSRPLEAGFTRDEQQEALVAVVALRRIVLPDQVLLEREVVFREGGLRVHHTESCIGDERRLVWREFLPTHSRTWVAEWSLAKATGRTIAYGWNRPIHEGLAEAPGGAKRVVGPLELLEQLRRGALDPGSQLALVDPSAAVIVDASVHAEGAALAVRRADGSLVLGGVLPGDPAVSGMRWAAGDARFVPVDAAEFGRHRRRWRVASRRPYDAVLAAIPDRR